MKFRPAGQDIDALLRLYNRGLPPGCRTGWPCVDQFYTVGSSQFTVVTGVPSHGKSSWLDALLVNLLHQKCEGKEWRFLICSPENWPVELHESKLLARLIGKRFGAGNARMNEAEIRSTCDRVLSQRFEFAELGEDETFPDLLIAARDFAAKHRQHQVGIVLDPWNQLEHCRPAHMTETEYISHALSASIRITRKTGAHLWIVAHPAKLFKDRDTGKRPVPTPYDVAGSAHWFNKADNCVTIWRDTGSEWTDEVDVHVQKVRFQHIGKHGIATLRYDIATGRYRDPNAAEQYAEARGQHEHLWQREPGENG